MVKVIQAKNTGIENLSALLKSTESLCLDSSLWNAASNIQNQLEQFKDHVWLSTSGSKSKKLVALSKAALRVSAKSVNTWLNVEEKDCWALALPLDHIGGLSILVRSLETNFKVVHFAKRWEPFSFCNFVAKERSTLCSLVPTQLFDLISRELQCPPSLRAVVIGGANLSPSIYWKARELNWPILPSYGLTECCSQVATSSLESLNNSTDEPALILLPHLSCQTDETRSLFIKGESLLSAYVHFVSNKQAELETIDSSQYFKTEDLVKIELKETRTEIKIIGRADRQLKIRGWFVSLDELEEKILSFFNSKALQPLLAIIAKQDEREGFRLTLNISSGSSAVTMLTEINEYLTKQIAHCPIIAEIIELQEFPLLPNGKIDQVALGSLGK